MRKLSAKQDSSEAFKPLFVSLSVCAGVLVLVTLAGILTRVEERRIDITSGRVRKSLYEFGIRVSDQEQDTEFKKYSPAGAKPDDTSKWRIVSRTYYTRWWRRNMYNLNEHFVYGDLHTDLKTFALMCDLYDVPDEECRFVADRMLSHLQTGDREAATTEVNEFQQKLEERYPDRNPKNRRSKQNGS